MDTAGRLLRATESLENFMAQHPTAICAHTTTQNEEPAYSSSYSMTKLQNLPLNDSNVGRWSLVAAAEKLLRRSN
jgi:hypothetical protein